MLGQDFLEELEELRRNPVSKSRGAKNPAAKSTGKAGAAAKSAKNSGKKTVKFDEKQMQAALPEAGSRFSVL